MNRISTFALVCWAALQSFVVSSGCKITQCTETAADGATSKKDHCLSAEPTIEYREGTPRIASETWSPGRAVSIINHNGPLRVDVDTTLEGRVTVSGIAFTREVASEVGKQNATDRLAQTAAPSLTVDDLGHIAIDAPGQGVVDGYDLTVRLPPAFDGALKIDAQNGKLTLLGADRAEKTTATAHGIVAHNLRNAIHLTSTVGEIEVSALPSGGGNFIHSEVGNIRATIGLANLAITAKTALGRVTFPPSWSATMVTADGLSGTVNLGDASGSLAVTTENGNIDFSLP